MLLRVECLGCTTLCAVAVHDRLEVRMCESEIGYKDHFWSASLGW